MNRNNSFAAVVAGIAVLCIGFCGAGCGEDKLGANEAEIEKVLASATPHAGHAVRTTISVPVQEAAYAALAGTGQVGGIVARPAYTDERRCLGCIRHEDLRP